MEGSHSAAPGIMLKRLLRSKLVSNSIRAGRKWTNAPQYIILEKIFTMTAARKVFFCESGTADDFRTAEIAVNATTTAHSKIALLAMLYLMTVSTGRFSGLIPTEITALPQLYS